MNWLCVCASFDATRAQPCEGHTRGGHDRELAPSSAAHRPALLTPRNVAVSFTSAKATRDAVHDGNMETPMKPRNLPSIDTEADESGGRTDAHLGPSDSSDSASDLEGLGGMDDDDPNVPVDVALREDGRRSLSSAEALSGAASDSAGTGESRSAGADAGVEAADVGVDRVFTPGRQQGGSAEDDEDQDLAFMDPPNESEPQQPDGLQGEDDDAPGAGPAAAPVTTRSRRKRSNHPKQKP